MRVIARKKLREYSLKYEDAKAQLDAWYHEVIASDWKGPQDIKDNYVSASFLHNNRVVFNIKGNNYRLVVHVCYPAQIVYILWFGLHKDYDRMSFQVRQ